MINLVKKLFATLSKKRKKGFTILLGQMMLCMVLEMLGIGLIVPILALMTSPDILDQYTNSSSIYSMLGKPSHSEMIAIVMCLLVVVYAVKSGFLLFFAWRQMKYIADVKAETSQSLFNGYLRRPYTFHLQHNSAELIRNITNDSARFSKSLMSILDLSASSLNFFGILAILLWIEPVGTAVVFVFIILFALGFYILFKSRMEILGEQNRFHEKGVTQYLLQGLGSIKDVLLMGRVKDIENRYWIHNIGVAYVVMKQKFLLALPKVGFEMIVVISLAGLVLSLMYLGRPIDQLLPILGLFAVAGFRLMPIVARIFESVQKLRNFKPSTEHVIRELNSNEQRRADFLASSATSDSAVGDYSSWKQLHVAGINYQYESAKEVALHDIDIAINKGETVGFIGESGAGKSTLIDIVLGLLSPSNGSVKLDDVDIHINLRGWQDQIGYVPQSIYLSDDSIKSNIAFGLADESIDEAAVNKAIKAAQLDSFIADLDQGIEANVGEDGVRLSGGQRQRIGIARALYHNPTVLVLDEATSALDEETEREFMNAVNRLHGSKTIIIIAHRLSTVEHCDRLYRMKNGKIIEHGNYDEIVLNVRQVSK